MIREANTTTESLSELRSQIDKIDDELLELLVRRMRVSRDIGQYKKEHNMPILQAKRTKTCWRDARSRPYSWAWTANSCARCCRPSTRSRSASRCRCWANDGLLHFG